MTPAEYCENKARGAGSSFFYAFLFLPEKKRRAMIALYAFCREVDNIADDVHDEGVAMRKLQFWREEIDRTFSGNPNHPIGKELDWSHQQRPLSKGLFSDIMDGMSMDVAHVPIQKNKDLSLYCYRVAGAVGLLSTEIFGCTDEKTCEFARALGEALQLTNILRDIKEDASRGRIYFPQQERIHFGVADQDFMEGNLTEGMQSLLDSYGEHAKGCYAKALDLLPAADRKKLSASLLMGSIYYAHLKRLKAVRFDIWQHNIRLLPIHKMWIAWRAWLYEKSAHKNSMPPRLDF